MVAKWVKFQVLDTERQDWARGYDAARRYLEREGSLDVPYEHAEGAYPLGRWLSDQRMAYRAGTMPSTRADELEELGMIWDTADAQFAENLAAARAYYAEAGTLAAPRHATALDRPHYRHDVEQIARLAWALMPAHLQPHRLPGPTAVAALPLAREDADRYRPVASSSFSRAA